MTEGVLFCGESSSWCWPCTGSMLRVHAMLAPVPGLAGRLDSTLAASLPVPGSAMRSHEQQDTLRAVARTPLGGVSELSLVADMLCPVSFSLHPLKRDPEPFPCTLHLLNHNPEPPPMHRRSARRCLRSCRPWRTGSMMRARTKRSRCMSQSWRSSRCVRRGRGGCVNGWADVFVKNIDWAKNGCGRGCCVEGQLSS